MDLNDLKNRWRLQRMERFTNVLRRKNPNIKDVSNVQLLMGINEKTYKNGLVVEKQEQKHCVWVKTVKAEVLKDDVLPKRKTKHHCNCLKSRKDKLKEKETEELNSEEAFGEDEKENKDSRLFVCYSSFSNLHKTKSNEKSSSLVSSQNDSKSKEFRKSLPVQLPKTEFGDDENKYLCNSSLSLLRSPNFISKETMELRKCSEIKRKKNSLETEAFGIDKENLDSRLLDSNSPLSSLQSRNNVGAILTEPHPGSKAIGEDKNENKDSSLLNCNGSQSLQTQNVSKEAKDSIKYLSGAISKVEKTEMTNSNDIPRVISSLPLELTAKFESLCISNHFNDLGISEINPDKGLSEKKDENEADGSNFIPQHYHNFEALKNWLQSSKKAYTSMEEYLKIKETNSYYETKENECKLAFLKKVVVDLCRMTSVGFPVEESEKILNEFSTMSEKIKDEPVYLQCKTLINVIKDQVDYKRNEEIRTDSNEVPSSTVGFKIVKCRKKNGAGSDYFMTPVRRSARKKNNQTTMSEPTKIFKFKPNEFFF